MFSLNKNKDQFINTLKLLPRTEADMNLPRFSLCFMEFFSVRGFFVLVWFRFVVGVFVFILCFYFSPHSLYIHLRKSLKTSYACKTSLPGQSCLHYGNVYPSKVLWHFIRAHSRSSGILASTCKMHQEQDLVLVLQEPLFTLTFTFGCPPHHSLNGKNRAETGLNLLYV